MIIQGECDESRVIPIRVIIPGACHGCGAMEHYMLNAGKIYIWH